MPFHILCSPIAPVEVLVQVALLLTIQKAPSHMREVIPMVNLDVDDLAVLHLLQSRTKSAHLHSAQPCRVILRVVPMQQR